MKYDKKLTWKYLQMLVRTARRCEEDILDPNISHKEDLPGSSEYSRANDGLMQTLRKLHLLRIPLHYTQSGKLYIVREECEHITFPQESEDTVRDLNIFYSEYLSHSRAGKPKDLALQKYSQILHNLELSGVEVELVNDKSSSPHYKLKDDDLGEWTRWI